MSLRTVTQNAGWGLTASVVARGGNFALAVLMARMTSPDEFGAYSYALVTSSLVASLLSAPLATVVTRSVAARHIGTHPIDRSVATSLLSYGLMTTMLPAVGLAIFAPTVGNFTLGTDAAVVLLQVSSIYAGLSGLFLLATGVLVGLQDFSRLASANLINWAVTLLTVGLLFPILGPLAGILGPSLGSLVGSLLAVGPAIAWYRSLSQTAGNSGSLSRAFISFYIPILLSGLSVGPVNWAGLALLARVDGQTEVAAYQAHLTISSVVLLLPAIIAQVSLPHFSRQLGMGQEAPKQVAVAISLGLGLSAAILLLPTAHLLFSTVLGTNYTDSAGVLSWQALAAALAATGSVVGQLYVAAGKVWLTLAFNVVAGTIFLVACSILVPRHGAVGLAWANVVEYTLHLSLTALIASRALKIRLILPLAITLLGVTAFILIALLDHGSGAQLLLSIGTGGALLAGCALYTLGRVGGVSFRRSST